MKLFTKKRALVLEALEALDDERRQVFVLHELDELAIPDVARVLKIPVPTAYTRLRAARKTFAEAVRRLAAMSSRPQRVPLAAMGRSAGGA